LTTVVFGQKLPIFTEAGLPHDALALQLITQARAPALARTARRLNALDQSMLPRIAGEIHAITNALEEDERDEATRRKIGTAIGPAPLTPSTG
jgi:hypothetical protein